MSEEKVVKPIASTPPPAVSEPVVEPATQATPDEVDPTKVDTLIPSDDYRISPLWYEVVSYFGIPQEEWDGAKNEVSTIVDYVIREIKSNDSSKILLKLREIEDSITPPEWGLKRYKNIYRYIRLAAKKQAIESSMDAFKKR